MKNILIFTDLFLRLLRVISPIAYIMSMTNFYNGRYDTGLIFLSLGILFFQIHPTWFTLRSIANTLAWIDKGCPEPTLYEVQENTEKNDNDKRK